jgi:NAD(P)-dependent dehydrogenase (short-subunit alcohol dehydrogenase family)
MSKLRDKVVLITGGAHGIGATTARAVVARGAKVVLLDIDPAPLDALQAQLGADNALSAVADVTDLGAVERATAAAVARFGGIDIVVANAGVASYGSVQGVDPAAFRRVIDINVTGVFHTVRAALPSVTSRKGYILVVSSLAAFAPAPGMAAYGASKAAVEQFASALRLELAHQGVDVGSAHMSWIDTPLVRDAKSDLSSFAEMLAALPGPLGRTTSVEACVDAFVRALERRQRRVYVPGWVGLVGWLKALVTVPAAEGRTLALVPRILPKMDAEVAALGRSTSARNLASGAVRSGPAGR